MDKGFLKVGDLLQKLRLLNGDEEMFLNWIKEACDADRRRGMYCYMCLIVLWEAHPSQS